MGADRKRYVMSVELAMQREMAYRKKHERLKAEQSRNSAVITPQKDLFFSQVHASTTIPNPTPRLFPNPRPHPSVGFKPHQAPPQMRTAYSGLDSIAQVQSSTLTPAQRITPTPGSNSIPFRPTHVPMQNHPRPVPYTGPTPSYTPSLRPNPQPPRPTYGAHQKRKPSFHHHHQPKRSIHVYSPEDFYCHLCKVYCTSEINLRMHIKGQKHKSMLRNGQAASVTVRTPEGNDKLHYCELCGIRCPDMHAFTLHLNGKNHFLRLRASEMKLKGPDGSNSVM